MTPTALVFLSLVFGGMLALLAHPRLRDHKTAKVAITCNHKGCPATLKVDPEIFRDARQVVSHAALTKAQWTAVPVVTPAGKTHGVRTFCPFHSGGQS